MKNKIRILLLVLTVLFLATAAFIRSTVTEKELLNLDAKKLTRLLHKKEAVLDSTYANPLILSTFTNSERYPLQLKEISSQYESQNIFFYIFKDTKPIFWSSNIYVPETSAGLKEGISILKAENFTFIANHKKLSNNVTSVALIPIERNFEINYKPNGEYNFYALLSTNNLQLANFSDSENIKNIYDTNKNYLFSVKLKDEKSNNIFVTIQLICWMCATLCFIIFINSFCLQIAKNGKPLLSTFLLLITFVIIRIIDLETNWLAQNSSIELFSPKHYAYNYFTPNLWSFLINTASVFWLVCYLIYIKRYITISEKFKSKYIGEITYYILLCGLYLVFNYIFDRLASLITNSESPNQEFLQILYSSKYNYVHVIIYALSVLSILFITDLVLSFGRKVCPKITLNLNIQLITLVQFLLIGAFQNDFSLIHILFGLLIIIRSFDHTELKENNISTRLISIITIALISTIKYAEASKHNQLEHMKLTLSNLESDEDIQASSMFASIERDINNDTHLKNIIKLSIEKNNQDLIDEYIKKKYFTGYLTNYSVNGYYFINDKPFMEYNRDVIKDYREKVISQSSKVSQTNNFYRIKTLSGSQDYFSILNLNFGDKDFGLILNIERITKNNHANIPFISQLYSFDSNSLTKQSNISFAIYNNGVLVNQNGKYTYQNIDLNRNKPINDFIQLEDTDGYYHMMFKPNRETTIIVSKAYQSYWQFITVASIAFLLLYLTTGITKLIFIILPRYFKEDFRLRHISFQIRYLLARVRYSTRIQSLVISSVLIAIIISGIISYISIKIQTTKNLQTQRLNYISEVVNNLESIIAKDTISSKVNELNNVMTSLSKVLVTDFNLYDKSGKLFYTTQPNIYNHQLISSYINPNAFIDLNVLKKNETDFEENILDFEYESTYATIKNENLSTVAYLSVPYFNSREIETENTNILFKTILNIYTVITIVFAFLSVFISNKITEPLQLIRKRLSQINLSGKSNEPLYWEKNDEIGVIVKEYNYMLIKLEESARQLRNAERENVWREMAQQVAHEVKNPLTPMKLGIQQLTRSFNDNDPRFEERFRKISNSFIEQIDSLSLIASEFSAFAKLPETKYMHINIVEKITKCIDVYNNTNHTEIELFNNTAKDEIMVLGDRDQLLRTFNNLIKNAIEAASGRKKIKIDITIENINDDNIKITVADNGFGIPNEVIPNIFKPNFTTKSSGTGLGLAFVKQTITAMGGDINFHTQFNIGTEFYITIPLIKLDN